MSVSNPISKAIQVLNTYWDGKLPVNIEIIAVKAGIEIQWEKPAIDEETGHEISGRIEADFQGNPIITISSTDPYNRQRFVIAHELGHCFMGHKIKHRIDTFTIKENPFERHEEWEADEFAAALLIPKDTVILVLDKMDNPTISKFANVFEVSEQVMAVRLRRLGII